MRHTEDAELSMRLQQQRDHHCAARGLFLYLTVTIALHDIRFRTAASHHIAAGGSVRPSP